MQDQKLYTITLTAQEVLLTSAIIGNTSAIDAIRDLSDYECITKSSFGSLYPLFLETKNPPSTDKTLGGKLQDLYSKLFKTLEEKVHEDFKPKTRKVYFCLYKNYNNTIQTSGLFNSEEKLKDTVTDHIVEIFEREIPV